ncbi:hypothetical protein YGS_C1P2763 [Sphingobium sp. YG1]|nr:hypothetical protein YGS_C1P2763 [Sphingobium sp. YG1]
MSGSICSAVAVAANEPLVRGIVARADTFFVATYADIDDQGRQVDMSHRGGPSGFIRLQDDGSMIIPDYNGNQYFNTLGNMLLNSRAGLVFPDFASGSLLQLTGDVDIDLTSDAIATFAGAERLWRFKPHSGVYRAGALPLRWKIRDGETLASG